MVISRKALIALLVGGLGLLFGGYAIGVLASDEPAAVEVRVKPVAVTPDACVDALGVAGRIIDAQEGVRQAAGDGLSEYALPGASPSQVQALLVHLGELSPGTGPDARAVLDRESRKCRADQP